MSLWNSALNKTQTSDQNHSTICWMHQAFPYFWSNYWPTWAENWQICQHSASNFQVDSENSCVMCSVTTERPYTCQIHTVQRNMSMAWVSLAGTGTWTESSEIWSFNMELPLLLIISKSISWTEKEKWYIREEEGLGKSTMTQNFGIFNLLHRLQLLATF